MRTAEEIRAAKVQQLGHVLTRPGMWGTGLAYEMAVWGVLHDLVFIDEREADLDRLTSTGVQGALAQFGDDECSVTDRTASVYARVAARLGYYEPARRLTPGEWVRARKGAATWARSGERTLADVEAHFGKPSYEKASWPSVLAYAGAEDDDWLYFDFENRFPNPRLELVRLPRRPFARSVIDLRPKPTQSVQRKRR